MDELPVWLMAAIGMAHVVILAMVSQLSGRVNKFTEDVRSDYRHLSNQVNGLRNEVRTEVDQLRERLHQHRIEVAERFMPRVEVAQDIKDALHPMETTLSELREDLRRYMHHGDIS